MSGLLLMLSFFTRIPLGKWVKYSESRYISGLVTFPIVGIVIGAFLTLPSFIPGLTPSLKAILTLFLYLIVTGGIHLDGLADSCDGLFSNRPKARVLEIMKDPHIGSFGVIALILYMLSFYAGASEVSWQWLFLMPFVGKTLGFFSAGFSRYAREEQGMGFLFIDRIKPWQGLSYLSVAFGVSGFVLGIKGIFALLAALLVVFWLMRLTKKIIGGQTGDTIGLIIEVSQIVFLLCGAILKAV